MVSGHEELRYPVATGAALEMNVLSVREITPVLLLTIFSASIFEQRVGVPKMQLIPSLHSHILIQAHCCTFGILTSRLGFLSQSSTTIVRTLHFTGNGL